MKSVAEWQHDLVGMVLDINPAEIGSHLEDLGSWCKVWQAEMIRRIYNTPVIGVHSATITVPTRTSGNVNKQYTGDDPNYFNTITTTGSV